jgi:hypothetical protein
MSEPTKSLTEALVLLQADLPRIEKSKTADVRTKDGSYRYTYADLTEISAAILPRLAAVGLAWICKPTLNADGKFVLAYALKHVSGESETGEYPLSGSGTPQQLGSGISYGRRYCLVAVTGLAPADEDDDGEAAEQQGTAQRRQQTRQQRPAGRTAQRAPRPDDDEPPPPPDEGAFVEPVTQAQLKRLHTVLSNQGIIEREEKLGIARRALDLPDLPSSTALSKADAGRLLDLLDKAEQHPDGFTGWVASLGGDR